MEYMNVIIIQISETGYQCTMTLPSLNDGTTTTVLLKVNSDGIPDSKNIYIACYINCISVKVTRERQSKHFLHRLST